MKVAFKWRANESTFLYITGLISGSTVVDGKPMIFDSLEKECTYYDGTDLVTITGISKTMIPDMDIANKVKSMSEDEYSTAYDAMKRLASLYPATQAFKFMDYTYYYNLENDECVEEKLFPICDTDLIDVVVNARRSMTLSVASSTTLSIIDGEVGFDVSGKRAISMSDSGMTMSYDGSNDEVYFGLSGNNSKFNVESENIDLVGREAVVVSGETVDIKGDNVNISTETGQLNINGKDSVNINSDVNVAIEGFNFNDNTMTYGKENDTGVHILTENNSLLNQLRGESLISGTSYECLAYYKLHNDRDKILYNRVGYNSIDKDGTFMESEMKMFPKDLNISLNNKKGPRGVRNYGIDMNFFIDKDDKASTESCSWNNSLSHYNTDYKGEYGLCVNMDMVNSASTSTNKNSTRFIISEIGIDDPSLPKARDIFAITDEFTYQKGPLNPHRVAYITTDVDSIQLKADTQIDINAPTVLINNTSIASIGSAVTSVNTGSSTIDMSLTQIGTQGKRLNAEIKDSSITSTHISNNAIVTRHISDKNVTTDKLADSAVTEDKIANDAVTADKIVNSAITSVKIANDAVTTDKIENSAVTNDKLAQNAVDTNNIKANAITKAKLDNSVQYGLAPLGSIMIWPGEKSNKPNGWMILPSASTNSDADTYIPVMYVNDNNNGRWQINDGSGSYSKWTINGVEYVDLEEWINNNKWLIRSLSSQNHFLTSITPSTSPQHIMLPAMAYLQKNDGALIHDYNYYMMRYK